MFRDTFAVEMLLAGVPLEQVSMLLGHKSVKITEKHYAPWVKARQEQMEQNVRKAWGSNVATIGTDRRARLANWRS
jgi:integrase